VIGVVYRGYLCGPGLPVAGGPTPAIVETTTVTPDIDGSTVVEDPSPVITGSVEYVPQVSGESDPTTPGDPAPQITGSNEVKPEIKK